MLNFIQFSKNETNNERMKKLFYTSYFLNKNNILIHNYEDLNNLIKSCDVDIGNHYIDNNAHRL